jgi:hypothetical protein
VCIRLCDQSSKHEHGGPVVCACEHLCVSEHALRARAATRWGWRESTHSNARK